MKHSLSKNIFHIVIWFLHQLGKFSYAVSNKKRDCVRGMILVGNEMLQIKNIGSFHWSYPGGGIEKGEDLKIALTRELKEELGIIVNPDQITFLESRIDVPGKIRGTQHFFKIELERKPELKLQWEIYDVRWVATSEVEANRLNFGS